MAIASVSSLLKIHSFPNGEIINTYKLATNKVAATDYIKTISWGKEGTWIVLVPDKGKPEVVSTKDQIKHLLSINEVKQPLCAAFQSKTKRHVVIGTRNGDVVVFDIKNKQIRKTFPKAPASVFRVEYTNTDSHLLAACNNGEILLYSTMTGTISANLFVPDSKKISTFRCHPNKRNLLVAGSEEGIIAVWDINHNKMKSNLQSHAATILDACFSPIRSDLIVTVGADRRYCFLDTASNKNIFEFNADIPLSCVDFAPDGIGLAIGCGNGMIYSFDTRKMNTRLSEFQGHEGVIRQILFRPIVLEDESFNTAEDENVDINNKNLESKQISYDTFEKILSSPMITLKDDSTKTDKSQDDSFLAVMKMTNSFSKTANSMKQTIDATTSETVKSLLDSPSMLLNPNRDQVGHQPLHLNTPLQGLLMNIRNKPLDNIKCSPKTTSKMRISMVASTPVNVALPEENSGESPIPPADKEDKDMKTIIKEAVREVVREELEKVITEKVRYEIMDLKVLLQRGILEMQMSMVKNNLKVERIVKNLQNVLPEEDRLPL